MWKINKERLASGLKVGIVLFGLLFGIFFVFFGIPLSVIENEKILHIYIPSVILVILLPVLVILYYSCIAYKNNKPKYIDGKYVWKDGRVYEGDRENGKANGKGKFTRTDGFCYEGEFKDGKFSGKGKSEVNGTVLEGTRVDGFLEGKGKLVGHDGGYYEGEFKKSKPHGMGIIKMINGYYYEGEFFEGKIKGKFKKQILSNGDIIEGDFKDDKISGIEGVGKRVISGYIFEGTFEKGVLNGEGKLTTPDGEVFVGTFDNLEFKKGKKISKNGEYVEGDWINGHLTGKAKYYFKDGSYYEGEYLNTGWQGIGTYVTKKGDKYPTEFPYKIINDFLSCYLSKIKEIDGNLKYIPKSEKEKTDEKNMYLKILEEGTSLQKEVARLELEEYEKVETLQAFIKRDKSIQNILKFYKTMLKSNEKWYEKNMDIAQKYRIKVEEKSSYSYGQYFYRLDRTYTKVRDVNVLFIKISEFLHPKNILSFVTKREKKEKERLILIDDFSDKYNKYIQGCLDWREYEKKFWEHNFKPDKNKKHEKIKK